MINDKLKMIGVIEGYESSDDGATWKKFLSKKNLITESGIQNFYKLFLGESTGYEVGFVAVGDGSSTVAKTDTIIDGEYGRYAISSQKIKLIGVDYWIENIINFDAGEANGTIRKIGIIGHGPTTTLGNYDPLLPAKAGAEWTLSNYADVLMPNGKVKDINLILKFIWRIKLT